MSNSQSGIQNLLRISAGIITAIGLLLSAPAFAGINDIVSANNQVVAQMQYNYMNYTESVNENETGNGGGLDSENGHITGYGLSGSAMRDLWFGHDYFDVRYSAFTGKTDYKGEALGSTGYGSLVGESGAKIKEGSIRFGSGIVMEDELMVTPYGELGRHKYVRTIMIGTPASYQETYAHNYFGLGALVQFSPSEKFVYSFNLLLGRIYGANIDAVMPAPFTGFSAKLGSSTLQKVGFSIDYAIAKNIHVNAAVDMIGWKYGASASQPVGNGIYVYEPSSITNITTAKVGVGFAF